MSRLQSRGSIALAAMMVALLSSRDARAQYGFVPGVPRIPVGVDPGPPRIPGGLVHAMISGAQYDIKNQELAEHRLEKVQAKLRRDTERCNPAAVNHDLRRIDNLRYRIVIDEWLIRWNMREYPDFYPYRTDPVSAAAIAQAGHPFYP